MLLVVTVQHCAGFDRRGQVRKAEPPRLRKRLWAERRYPDGRMGALHGQRIQPNFPPVAYLNCLPRPGSAHDLEARFENLALLARHHVERFQHIRCEATPNAQDQPPFAKLIQHCDLFRRLQGVA